ncbi:MAG: hypothetical protein WD018_06660 [Nitrosopumilaceae archaeon]
MGSSWTNRGTYGRILKKIIQKQLKRLEQVQDIDKSIQMTHNIGYLINTQREVIKDQESFDLEKRIRELEEKVGLK